MSFAFARRLAAASADPIPIVAVCHLSWDWVWQRPQQYLSRFARRHRVLFVETYCADVPETQVKLKTPDGHPNVTVLQMHLPASRWADGTFIDGERRRFARLEGLVTPPRVEQLRAAVGAAR